ncbi:MAG: response regulator transcription factor [Caldilineaceae bacterium]|nr:response regulator transcription factor [Caldilineaceae bacterium]
MNETPISILLIDDQATVLAGWRMNLALEPGLQVVGEAVDSADALKQVQRTCPDVILLDIKLAEQNGLDLLADLRRLAPGSAVIVLTVYDTAANRERALDGGAFAFLSKQAPFDTLLETIRRVGGR